MVVFTCNHCGDSIQKPRVEKHIFIECKKKYMNPSLCCIDCLKDFDIKSYPEHIQCVSEAERYSGKGFVAKASSNKGEKKQTSWIEVIHTVLKQQDMTKDQKKILQQIANNSNVPRKKAKFLNFINSSFKWARNYPDAVNSVFDLIETEFKASSQTTIKKEAKPLEVSKNEEKIESQETLTNNEKSEPQETHKNVEISTETIIDHDDEFEVVKKKKKRKKDKKPKEEQDEKVAPQTVEKQPIENDFEDYEGKGLSKKKQKKLQIQKVLENEAENSIAEENCASQESVPVAVVEEETPNTIDVTNLSKKEKKELRKKLKYEAELKTISKISTEKINNQENQGDENLKRDKKKKRKFAENGETEEVAVKKSKIEDQFETIIEECVKFSWEDIIRTLLEKAHGNEMSLKKLSKKTVAEYQAFYDSQKPYEDIEKRFHKKVNKLHFVKVFKDKVKLYNPA